ncbi:MAG: cupin domain-containing protein [Rhodothermia bacterium]|nr:cupin domain-containing protein [Rhodothermia bacterium]
MQNSDGPFAPANLVSTQDGAIVSKVLLKNRQGSVTLFAFGRGEELSEHTVPHDALLQIIEGAARIRIADSDFLVNRDEAIILPAGVPHAVMAEQSFKMILTMIRPPKDQ